MYNTRRIMKGIELNIKLYPEISPKTSMNEFSTKVLIAKDKHT
jgi:hypothetical protein